MFARFTSPAVAINRESTTRIGVPLTIGGVQIAAGDIICGDEDGLVVISQVRPPQLLPIAICQLTRDVCAWIVVVSKRQ